VLDAEKAWVDVNRKFFVAVTAGYRDFSNAGVLVELGMVVRELKGVAVGTGDRSSAVTDANRNLRSPG
jgi:hypothetical protein